MSADTEHRKFAAIIFTGMVSYGVILFWTAIFEPPRLRKALMRGFGCSLGLEPRS
jgi:hypothetical protein